VLSVIVPTRDTRELALACLAALAAAEEAGEIEVLVVDDASRDGTAGAVAAAFPAARVLELPAAVGFTAAANRGLAAARGDILLLLNSDTEIARDGLAALRRALAAAPRLGVAGAQLHYPDGRAQWSGGPAPSLLWLLAQSSGLPALLAGRLRRPLRGHRGGPVEWVTGAALAVRRRVLEEIGPLDERFAFYAQDLDFCLRARRRGWEVAVVPGFNVLHHHGASIGRAAGAVRGVEPGLLWQDLLRWAEKSRGPAWRRRAGRAVALGSALRLAARALRQPFLRSTRRDAFREESRALARARRAARSVAGGP
jgi:GT2 family glycosyltransferase